MIGLRGLRVVVTGATGALGPTLVEAFLSLGANVVGVARLRTGLDDLRARVSHHERLHVAECDLTDGAGVEALFDALERKGAVDAVVHAVGAFSSGPLTEIEDAKVARLVALNLTSGAFVMRTAVRRMAPRGRGSIVVVAADAARAPAAGRALYGATKAGLVHLCEAVSLEMAGSEVRVNAILPGTLDTDANRRAMPEADPAGWVSPARVASAAVWLAGPESAGVSGAMVRLVRGGPPEALRPSACASMDGVSSCPPL